MGYFNRKFMMIDNTSDATFRTWGKAISDEIAAMGWVQQNDTGQPVWAQTTFNVTNITRSGGNNIVTYSGLAGPALRIGMSVTLAGCTTGANNGTFTITALAGSTFTVVNGSGVTEAETATGSNTLSTRPSANWLYEVWAMADALQTGATQIFFVIGYGSVSGTTSPSLKVGICTATNGAGVLAGFNSTLIGLPNNSLGNTTTPTLCYFCGDTNRLAMSLSAVSRSVEFGVERTKASDGSDSSVGVAILTNIGSGSQNGEDYLATVVFGVGTAQYGNAPPSSQAPNLLGTDDGTSFIFDNKIPLSPIFPVYGKFGYPMTIFCVYPKNDIPSLVVFEVVVYGVTRLYVSGQGSSFSGASTAPNLAMRYD
jgi:hypothetical protein